MIQFQINLYYKCFPKDIDEVWFIDQAIWREDHRSEYDLKKPAEECEDPEAETMQS